MRPICSQKSVLRKNQGRAEETSSILSTLPPTRATRPPRCAGDADRPKTSLVPFRDWRGWHTQRICDLEKAVTCPSWCIHSFIASTSQRTSRILLMCLWSPMCLKNLSNILCASLCRKQIQSFVVDFSPYLLLIRSELVPMCSPTHHPTSRSTARMGRSLPTDQRSRCIRSTRGRRWVQPWDAKVLRPRQGPRMSPGWSGFCIIHQLCRGAIERSRGWFRNSKLERWNNCI